MGEQEVSSGQPASDARPVNCQRCAGPVVSTEVGWTHVDQYGAFVGWVCPPPHFGLAIPPSR